MTNKQQRDRARAFRYIAYELAGKPIGQPRHCTRCGEPFQPAAENQKFCNIRCSTAHHQAARRKRRYAELRGDSEQ